MKLEIALIPGIFVFDILRQFKTWWEISLCELNENELWHFCTWSLLNQSSLYHRALYMLRSIQKHQISASQCITVIHKGNFFLIIPAFGTEYTQKKGESGH